MKAWPHGTRRFGRFISSLVVCWDQSSPQTPSMLNHSKLAAFTSIRIILKPALHQDCCSLVSSQLHRASCCRLLVRQYTIRRVPRFLVSISFPYHPPSSLPCILFLCSCQLFVFAFSFSSLSVSYCLLSYMTSPGRTLSLSSFSLLAKFI